MQCSVPPRLTSCELSMNSSGPTIDYSGAGKRERSAGDDRGEAFQPNSKRSLYGHSFRRAPRALLDVVPSKTSPRSFHLGAAETVRRACIVFAAPMLSRGPRLTRRLNSSEMGAQQKADPTRRHVDGNNRRGEEDNTSRPRYRTLCTADVAQKYDAPFEIVQERRWSPWARARRRLSTRSFASWLLFRLPRAQGQHSTGAATESFSTASFRRMSASSRDGLILCSNFELALAPVSGRKACPTALFSLARGSDERRSLRQAAR